MILLLACAWVGDEHVLDRVDADGDGYWSEQFGGFDCDDTDPKVNPGAQEVCNDIDDDCRPHNDAVEKPWHPDADGDGFGGDPVITCLADTTGWSEVGGDCDDDDADNFPGAVEVCGDGRDNDCDGVVDCLGDEPLALADQAVRILGRGDQSRLGLNLFVVDLHGDGDKDLLVTEILDNEHHLVWLPWESGTSDEAQWLGTVSYRTVPAELDGEPGAELVAQSPTAASWGWGEPLEWAPDFVFDGMPLTTLDVEGDGVDEVVLLHHQVDEVGIADADGVEVARYDDRCDFVSTGDADGDGLPELLRGCEDDFVDLLTVDGEVLAWWDLDVYGGWEEPRTVELTDLDGDGVAEVMLTSLSLSDGQDRGVGLVYFDPRGVQRVEDADAGFHGDVHALGAAGDLSGDGHVDLLAQVGDATDYVTVAPGPHRGWTHTLDMDRQLPRFSRWVAMDLDDDGFGDLVVADPFDSSGGSSAGVVALLYGP